MPKWPVAEKSNCIMSIKIIITIVLVAMSMPIGDVMADPSTRIQPCPKSPNCVCSDAVDDHAIAAFELATDPQQTWQKLHDYLKQQSAYTLIEIQDDYLRAEARTRLLRFVDDVEFELREEAGIIAVRSASRVGYSDLGANRRRIEKIRQAISQE